MSVVNCKHLIAILKHPDFAHEFRADLCDQGLPPRLHKKNNTSSLRIPEIYFEEKQFS